MKARAAILALTLCAPALAQDDATSVPACGEPCKLADTLKELRTLPKLPAKDPLPGDEFEPPVKAYSDCTVKAFQQNGGDWAAPAERIDVSLQAAYEACAAKRVEAQALFGDYFDKNSPDLSADQKRVYGSYVIGMHGMMTLGKHADAWSKQTEMRAYLLSKVSKDDFSFGLLYFDVGD